MPDQASLDSGDVVLGESPADDIPDTIEDALDSDSASPRGPLTSLGSPRNELKTGRDHRKPGYIHSARAGHINLHDGPRLLPRWKPGSVITYTIAENSFPTKGHAKFAQRALVEAAEDWNERDVGVRFQLVSQGERAVFALKYYRRSSGYFADSFFPDDETRILYIYTFSFRREYRRHMANIFRHEIGHVLGLRHDGAEAHEAEFPSVELTPQEGSSIMTYFTDPSTIHIQESDVVAARKLCTIDEDTFHDFEVVTIDPDTLDQVSFDDSDRLSSRGSDFASTTTEGSTRTTSEEEPALVDDDPEEMAPVGLTEPVPATAHECSLPIDFESEAPRITEEVQRPLSETREPASLVPEREPTPVNPEALMVPTTVRSRRDSTSQALANTDAGCTPQHYKTLDLDLQNALTPDSGREEMFLVQDNPFAFSPGQLTKLHCFKNHSAFYALGGLLGLEIGLRTDRKAGLSIDETVLEGAVSFEDAATGGIPRYGELGEKAPKSRRSEDCTSAPPYAYWLGRGKTGERDDGFTDRKRVFQTNRLPKPMKKSMICLAMDVYYGGCILMLLTFAALASLAWGVYRSLKPPPGGNDEPVAVGWAEGLAMLVCIALIVATQTGYQWKTERHFSRLDELRSWRDVNVMRSGGMRTIPAFDIMVGDVVYISAGDVIPADGILIDGHGLKCDESAATGECDIITKIPGDQVCTVLDDAINGARMHPRILNVMDPFIISGAIVTEGSGSFIATAVGINSSHGRTLLSMMEFREAGSHVQKLASLGTYTLRRLGLSVALLLFITSTIKFLAALPSSTLTPEEKGRDYLGLFIMALALSVVAAPLFLPNLGLMVTAFTMRMMLCDNNLVGSSEACEAVAEVTTICTTKTAVLTQGTMKVVAATIGKSKQFGDAIPPDNEMRALEATDGIGQNTAAIAGIPMTRLASTLGPWEKDLLTQSIAINSTAFENQSMDIGERAFVGSKTECALLTFSRDHLGSGPVHEERCNASVVQMLPFKACSKFMATTVMLPGGGFRVYMKGAAEILLKRCTRVISNTNPTDEKTSTVDLTDADRELLQLRVDSYGSRCLRPISLCYSDFTYCPSASDLETGGDGMTMLAILGIQDPLRHNVTEAVKHCRRAGIAVRMVTKDNVNTAMAIAKEADLLMDDAVVLEGRTFRTMTDQEQLGILPRVVVLARASPGDEYIFVKSLKELGETVAVVAGGIDDCLALKAAHVGFAKGITGSDAAKQAADVILMDDSLVSVIKSITWGRAVKDSIGKLLQYKLTAIATAAIITFVSAAATDKPVFNAVQLLWISLMTDLAVLALIVARPTKEIIDRRPIPVAGPIITIHMSKMIIGQVICQLIITLVILFAWFRFPGYTEKSNMADAKARRNTFVFNTFVWLQMFNILNSRRLDNRFDIFEGILRNPFFLLVSFLLVGGQVLIMLLGGAAFKVVHLNAREWTVSVGIGSLSLVGGMLLRLIPDSVIDQLTPGIVKRRLMQPRPASSFDSDRGW